MHLSPVWLGVVVFCLLWVNVTAHAPSLPCRLTAVRPPRPNAYNLTVAIMFRLWPGDAALQNMGTLVDWLEYHLLLGVNHFYLFDDAIDAAEAVGDHALIKHYEKEGLVTYHALHSTCQPRGDYGPRQVSIYENALKLYREESRWMMTLDYDEFITFVNPEISDLVEWLDKMKRSQVCWHSWFFAGATVEIDNPYLRTIDQFIWMAPDVHRYGRIKCAAQSVHLVHFTVHEHTVNVPGMQNPVNPEVAYMSHYWRDRMDLGHDFLLNTMLPDHYSDRLFARVLRRCLQANVSYDEVVLKIPEKQSELHPRGRLKRLGALRKTTAQRRNMVARMAEGLDIPELKESPVADQILTTNQTDFNRETAETIRRMAADFRRLADGVEAIVGLLNASLTLQQQHRHPP
jgi:hypothetical protein